MADITVPPPSPSTGLSTTPDQQLPVPDGNEALEELDYIIQILALALERQVVKVYDDVDDRADKLPTPDEGMICYLRSSNELQLHDGTNWVRVYPTSPRVLTGVANPLPGQGQVGDVYVQHP